MTERQIVDIKDAILVYLQDKYPKHKNFNKMEDIIEDVFEDHFNKFLEEFVSEMNTRHYGDEKE